VSARINRGVGKDKQHECAACVVNPSGLGYTHNLQQVLSDYYKRDGEK
jgi:hypothetical protein